MMSYSHSHTLGATYFALPHITAVHVFVLLLFALAPIFNVKMPTWSHVHDHVQNKLILKVIFKDFPKEHKSKGM